jgi:hypothetical protein
MAGNSARLDDPSLNGELEALLAVEPSAGFNARVWAAATARPRWRLSWLLASAGAIAVAALVIAMAGDFRTSEPSAPALTGRPFAGPLAQAPEVGSRPVIGTDPSTVSSASSRRAARTVGIDGHANPSALVVLIPLAESRALGQLLARSRPIQVASATDDSPLPLSETAPAPVRPLHVPRLAIEPLVPFEELSGGARP